MERPLYVRRFSPWSEKFTLALSGLDGTEKGYLNMMSLLLCVAFATMLVVGGTAVSLFLYTRSLSDVNHARYDRKPRQGYMDYATENPFSMRPGAANNEMSRYARNGLVFLLFGLIMAAMVIASIVNGLMR
jgi:hypothetical protein